MNILEQAEVIHADLREKLEGANPRLAELDDKRPELAFAAHAGTDLEVAAANRDRASLVAEIETLQKRAVALTPRRAPRTSPRIHF